ncbi:MAG: hypothetical protein DSY78_06820 [Chloroflexi bacterium]|nr:MAG: hypothetical protein BZY84_01005 [SAR202 cluster bacterium MP-SInd-SRR3963457-G1]PKB85373.1 MAG: hypothetical protein BZY86_02530 [SAR202 cluster bacterium MP-NPac-SRR3961935-G1]RUA31331.1 MAG: hypothetical protein DSY78_06820 [Chloroflexota bacterium]
MVSIEAGQHTQTRYQLASLIVSGNTLFDERLDSPNRFADWFTRYESWQANVIAWMSRNESVSVAFRFRLTDQEGPRIHYRYTSGAAHNRHLNRLRASIMYLGSI